LGISVSLEEQIPTLLSLQKKLEQLEKPPSLLVGGCCYEELKAIDGILGIRSKSFWFTHWSFKAKTLI